ncbi:hypothetical protein BSKO_07281 [Bryopsis sp. KO-2023]|nr:hypothetical protein BSKO_07281 [Bryopsis sp. KO-2023]
MIRSGVANRIACNPLSRPSPHNKLQPGKGIPLRKERTERRRLANFPIRATNPDQSGSTMGGVRLALLGAGIFASDVYVPLLKNHSDEVTLAAVWSRSEKSVQGILPSIQEFAPDVKARWGEGGLDELLADPEIDGVILVLAVQSMIQMITKCLKNGKHVLEEKPVAVSVDQALPAITAHRKESSASWNLAENFRFETAFLEGAKLVKEIGKVIKLEVAADIPANSSNNKYLKTAWRHDSEGCPGGFLLDSGVHLFAGYRMLAHAGGCGEPVTASCLTNQVDPSMPKPDVVIGWVQFEDGTPGSIAFTYSAGVMKTTYRVVGTEGTVEIVRSGFGKPFPGYSLCVKKKGESELFTQDLPFVGLETELKEFVRTIEAHKKGNKDFQLTDDGAKRLMPEEGLRDLAIIEALLKSSQSGGAPTDIAKIP